MKFADKSKIANEETPFDMKKKVAETKPVRLDKDLHQLLKMYSGYGDLTMVDMVNQAVEDYIEKHNVKQKIKEKNNQL